jgi:cell division GTPase FtsZ
LQERHLHQQIELIETKHGLPYYVNQIVDLDEGEIFYGTVFDPDARDELRVTVIATGLISVSRSVISSPPVMLINTPLALIIFTLSSNGLRYVRLKSLLTL